MTGFLDYVPGSSVLHRLDPLTKLVLSLGICVAAFVSDNLIFLLVLIALDILLGVLGGVFQKALRLLSGLLKLSVFLFLLQVLFVRSGTVLFELGILKVTLDGLFVGARLVLRLTAATLPLQLLLSVTQLSDLSGVLVQRLFVPYKYAFTLTTAIRFIPVFAAEMSGIIEAQTARGVEFDTKNPVKKIGLILPLCVPLLISSVGKIHESAAAAELRGFTLRTRESQSKRYVFVPADYAFLIFTVLLIAAGILF